MNIAPENCQKITARKLSENSPLSENNCEIDR